MKIALIGYGKMGHAIEQIVLSSADSHEVVLRVNSMNADSTSIEDLRKADIAIEFSKPGTAYNNIIKCFDAGIPVVCGTTSWLEKLNDIKKLCDGGQNTFIYSPNYSIGVNIFFKLNAYLAALMDRFEEYDVKIEETHHLSKHDAPSGTAIKLANDITSKIKRKIRWINRHSNETEDLIILSHRKADVPGTHSICYYSDIDSIQITHTAFNRMGFAKGALLAAEWLVNRRGFFLMEDLLNDLLANT